MKILVVIPKNHVLTRYTEALRSDDILVETYSGFWNILARCYKCKRKAPVVFYTPYKLLPMLTVVCPWPKYYYVLHEPRLSVQRAGWVRKLNYFSWLFVTSRNCKFISVSMNGSSMARQVSWLRDITIDDIVPLTLPGTAVPRQAPPSCYDIGMWGSINREKGIEHLLEVARNAPDLRVGILSSATPRMRELQKLCSTTLANVSFELHVGGFTEDQLDAFVDRLAVLALPQSEATQSGQLPIALRAGMPIVASDIPAFREYAVRSPKAVCCVALEKGKTAFVREMERCIRKILQEYPRHSEAASEQFNLFHSSNLVQERLRKAVAASNW